MAAEKRGILGGSFDPVHLGHLAMAAAAREAAELETMVFVPASVSPFKSTTVASDEQRLEMLRIALGENGLDWAEISREEIDRSGPSYSWMTAASFTRSFPAVDWHWILGTDQWEAIDRWAEPEKLRRLLTFVVLTREGTPVRHRPGWQYLAVPFAHPASSTAIRADRDGRAEWLSPGVLEYCRREDLYE